MAGGLPKVFISFCTAKTRPECITLIKALAQGDTTIVAEVSRLLDDLKTNLERARGISPYGDGHAAQRIVHLYAHTWIESSRFCKLKS